MAELQVPPSPGVGARRKGPSSLPRLPLSAFAGPPSSGSSERFPVPQSPSAAYPTSIIDSSVSVKTVLAGWKADVGRNVSRKVNGVVLTLPSVSQSSAVDQWVSGIIHHAILIATEQDPRKSSKFEDSLCARPNRSRPGDTCRDTYFWSQCPRFFVSFICQEFSQAGRRTQVGTWKRLCCGR